MYQITNKMRSKGDPKVLQTGPSSLGSADRMARTMGWLGIGLGIMELIVPERVTRTLGMQGQEDLVRAFGAREIASGIVSLSVDKHVGLWMRVAGDGMDIAALLSAYRWTNPRRDNVKLAMGFVFGALLLDIVAPTAATTVAPTLVIGVILAFVGVILALDLGAEWRGGQGQTLLVSAALAKRGNDVGVAARDHDLGAGDRIVREITMDHDELAQRARPGGVKILH